MSKFTKAMSMFTLSAIGLAAQAIPVTQTIQTFGMVGLAEGQSAELNVLNPGVKEKESIPLASFVRAWRTPRSSTSGR